jgi:MFS family permease
MQNTAVTDNDWVCDKATRATDLFTLGVVGIIVGVAIFSTIADYKGRKPSFFICTGLMIVISIISVFVSHSYTAYLVLKVMYRNMYCLKICWPCNNR